MLEPEPPLTPDFILFDRVKNAAAKTTDMISAMIMGRLNLIS